MSTRIRYIPHTNGKLISAHAYKDYAGHDLRIVIFEDGVTGSIVFAAGEVPILTTKASSPHKIRIKLKKLLEKLGVKFESESRE